MTVEKIPSENKPENLADFKKEVAALKKKEEGDLNEKGLRKTAHFENINPEELTETDRQIYRKFLDEKLTVEELRAYQNQLQSGTES